MLINRLILDLRMFCLTPSGSLCAQVLPGPAFPLRRDTQAIEVYVHQQSITDTDSGHGSAPEMVVDQIQEVNYLLLTVRVTHKLSNNSQSYHCLGGREGAPRCGDEKALSYP